MCSNSIGKWSLQMERWRLLGSNSLYSIRKAVASVWTINSSSRDISWRRYSVDMRNTWRRVSRRGHIFLSCWQICSAMNALFDRILTLNLIATTLVFYVAARIYLLPNLARWSPRVVLVPILLLHSLRHLGLMFLTTGCSGNGKANATRLRIGSRV
jgi:hypothetical protein